MRRVAASKPHAQKIRNLRRMIHDRGLDTLIQIDGGVTTENAAGLIKAGADVLVADLAVAHRPLGQADVEASAGDATLD